MSAKTSNLNTTYLHCRFCAQKKTVYDLLDFEKDNESYKDYQEKIKYFDKEYFHFSPDSAIPKTICENCYVELEASYSFVEKVRKSLDFLTTLYNVKTEPGPCVVRAAPETKIKVEITNSESDDADDTIVTENTPNFTEIEISNTFKVDCELLETDNIQRSDTDTDNEEPKDQTWFSEEEICKNQISDSVENKESHSWTGYPWMCGHCGEKFNSMQLVRDHSKVMHNMCYAFQCADCDKTFTTFNLFTEHVRLHRRLLSYFCQYCNTWFESKQLCDNHTPTHWSGAQCICEMCGEIYPDFISLEHHKKSYKRPKLSKRERRMKPKQVIVKSKSKDLLDRSWLTYPWTCQDCSMKFSDVVSLRYHVQHLHKKCFSMKCVDCLKEMKHYRGFVDHVTNHRRFLKMFCPYCNEHIEDPNEMQRHIDEHFNGSQRPCDGCGQVFENKALFSKHMKEFDPPRRKGTLTKEDLECEFCGKISPSLANFKSHMKKHNNQRARHHTCDTCGKAFYNASTLRGHIKIHSQSKSEICQICKMQFSTKMRLKSHVMTHSEVKPFECHDCGKTFKTKARISAHVKIHNNQKPYKCVVCSKEFKHSCNLKIHMNQHTGLRPYECELCEKTFVNWSNCNKHMKRKHGVPLAKTKCTNVGRLAINRVTGLPEDIVCNNTTKAWAKNLFERKNNVAPREKNLSTLDASRV